MDALKLSVRRRHFDSTSATVVYAVAITVRTDRHITATIIGSFVRRKRIRGWVIQGCCGDASGGGARAPRPQSLCRRCFTVAKEVIIASLHLYYIFVIINNIGGDSAPRSGGSRRGNVANIVIGDLCSVHGMHPPL